MQGKRIYRVQEIQDILGIGQNTAYVLVRKRLFHSVNIGGHIRISKRSFDKWLEEAAGSYPQNQEVLTHEYD